MNKETAKMLIEKFSTGIINDAEYELLENYIEKGWIDLEELTDLTAIHEKLKLETTEIPTAAMRADFYEFLAEEKRALNAQKSKTPRSFFFQNFIKFNWGFSLATLFVGMLIGSLFFSQPDAQMDQLAEELRKTQEAMMLTLLEKESSRDRLKAVKITEKVDDVTNKMIEGLLTTLNNDENVNVRSAAIDALAGFSENPTVREGLIKSIKHQNSPLLQLKLAELMVALQDKRSAQEFQNLIQEKEIPTEVRDQLEEKIKVLL
ncbi:MAG: HEAT repeat domain-containing protein [Bacteroidota bacterium]